MRYRIINFDLHCTIYIHLNGEYYLILESYFIIVEIGNKNM